jgi:hypothetical protein
LFAICSWSTLGSVKFCRFNQEFWLQELVKLGRPQVLEGSRFWLIPARIQLSTAEKFCFLVVIPRLSACVPTRPGASQYAIRCRVLIRIHLRPIPDIDRHALIYARAQRISVHPVSPSRVCARTSSWTLHLPPWSLGCRGASRPWTARFRPTCTTRHQHSQFTYVRWFWSIF